MQATKKRKLKSGQSYNALFPPISQLQRSDKIIKQNGSVFDTLKFMEQIVLSTLPDTLGVAPQLKGNTLEQTAHAIFNFIYEHIQYRLDSPLAEQLHRPLRIWDKRKFGVDCDDYAIMASSILSNLKIPHYFRMTKYQNDWQHVYVIVPKSPHLNTETRSNYYVIDPVTDQADYEVPFTKKHDKKMKIQYLNGLGEATINHAVTLGFGNEFSDLDSISGLGATASRGDVLYQQFMDKLQKHLQNSLAILRTNPSAVADYDPQAYKEGLEKVLKVWNKPAQREAVLNELAVKEEQQASVSGLAGLFKKFFGGIKKAVKKVGNAIKKGVQAVGKGIKKVGQTVVKGVKAVGKAILRFNPLSVAIRAGLRAAFATNLAGMAGRLGWGYLTREQALANGVHLGDWSKHTKALHKVRGIYEDGLQGKKDKLKSAILKGFDKSGNSPIPIHQIGQNQSLPAAVKNTVEIQDVIATQQNLSTIQPVVSIDPRLVRPARPEFLLPPRMRLTGTDLGDATLGAEPASTAAASGLIAKIVAILKKINPIRLVKKGLKKLKEKKAAKELQLKDLMAEGISEKEARQILAAEKQRRKKANKELDKKFNPNNRFNIKELVAKVKDSKEVQKIAKDPTKYLNDRKELLNMAIKGDVKKLENGKILVESTDGKTIIANENELTQGPDGNLMVRNGAQVQTAGMNPILLIGTAAVVLGTIIYNRPKAPQNQPLKKKALAAV